MEFTPYRFEPNEQGKLQELCQQLSTLKKSEKLTIKQDDQGHWIIGKKPKPILWLFEKIYKPEHERIGVIDRFISRFIEENATLLEKDRKSIECLKKFQSNFIDQHKHTRPEFLKKIQGVVNDGSALSNYKKDSSTLQIIIRCAHDQELFLSPDVLNKIDSPVLKSIKDGWERSKDSKPKSLSEEIAAFQHRGSIPIRDILRKEKEGCLEILENFTAGQLATFLDNVSGTKELKALSASELTDVYAVADALLMDDLQKQILNTLRQRPLMEKLELLCNLYDEDRQDIPAIREELQITDFRDIIHHPEAKDLKRRLYNHLRIKADQDDASALYTLGTIFNRKTDLQRAAELGYPPAQYMYGIRLENKTEVYKWVHLSSRSGYIFATVELGKIYLEMGGTENILKGLLLLNLTTADEGFKRDWPDQAANLIKAANLECSKNPSIIIQALELINNKNLDILKDSLPENRDNDVCLDIIKKQLDRQVLAVFQDPKQLAEYKGDDLIKLQINLEEQSSENPAARLILAKCYKDGIGMPKDPAKALNILMMAPTGRLKEAQSLATELLWLAPHEMTSIIIDRIKDVNTQIEDLEKEIIELRSSPTSKSENLARLQKKKEELLSFREEITLFIDFSNNLDINKKDIPLVIQCLKESKSSASKFALAEYYFDEANVNKEEPGLYKEATGEAIKFYQQAAENGHILAAYKLGKCYKNGLCTEKNEEKAYQYYLQAAEKKYAPAEYEVGLATLPLDQETGMQWLERAANQEFSPAQYQLGLEILKNGSDELSKINSLKSANNYYKSFGSVARKWFEKAAKNGNQDARYEQGMYFDTVVKTSIRLNFNLSNFKERAFNYFLGAASKGYHKSSYAMLATYYESGFHVKKDSNKALLFYSSIALKDNSLDGLKEMFQTPGLCLDFWSGMDKEGDFIKTYSKEMPETLIQSIRWMLISEFPEQFTNVNTISKWDLASQKKLIQMIQNAKPNPEIQMLLAKYYAAGIGGEQDLKGAIQLLTQAAQEGNLEAQKELKALRDELRASLLQALELGRLYKLAGGEEIPIE